MLDLAGTCGFVPRLCRPYRAKTKGKVERFNAHLIGSFVVPLAATIEANGLRLDAALANVHVRRWLDEVANARVHATTKAVPAVRLAEERAVMLAALALAAPTPVSLRVALPIESLQHPLTVYDASRNPSGGASLNSRSSRGTSASARLTTHATSATDRPTAIAMARLTRAKCC